MFYNLFLSTHNADKIAELSAILSGFGISLFGRDDFTDFSDTIEDGKTIYENATKKALEGARHSGMLSLADDTGLFIDALGGDPGIYSARWAGEGCTYRDNRLLILEQMKDKSDRTAYFKTAVALTDDSGLIALSHGIVRGRITHEERGDFGFGYDSIFELEGFNKTYGEMNEEFKNRISHRALAIQNIIPSIKQVLLINE
ncbi:MAG: RdgB/HAM1 family non-canonical purine NTP pyrophosphatase [Candidatus Cloacimonetes bacterium]|nr:RdgB/HAM1 family non-canonical purine NTP pyrophosphatase [Candidatus Cloacimonadota bacterium]